MKTFKITRVEKIKEYQIIEAKNEEEALNKSNYEDWDDDELLSSEIEIEELN